MPTATEEAPAAAPSHTHADHHPELTHLPIDSIDRSRNHRVPRPGDEQRIANLMKSIEASGQLQPVRVYQVDDADMTKPRYILGFGWRRCEAMSRLGFEQVRAEVFPPAPDHEIEAARAIENIHRQDITPIEEAAAVADILAAYQEENPIATKREAIEHAAAETGRSVSWIRDRDYFTRLCAPVRELANKVAIPAGHLLELAKVGDEELQLEIALDAVGLGSHMVKPGTLEPDGTFGSDYVEEFFAEAAAGVIRIDKLYQVKKRVEEAQRSLKSVPWVMQLPVLVSGKTALPACDECPHNTANDLTLFGVDGEAPAHGTCMSPVCFTAKKEASEKARDKPLKQLLRMKNPAAKLSAKVEQAPDWLDKKKLKGFLQRKTKVQPDSPTGSSGSRAGAGAGGRNGIDANLDAALDKYERALNDWVKLAGDKLVAASLNDTPRRAGLILFLHTLAMEELCDGDVRVPASWDRRNGKTKPTSACEIGSDAAAIIDMIETGRPDEIVKIGAAPPAKFETIAFGGYWPDHPELLARLMVAMKVPAKNITAPPRWEDFDPAAATAKKTPIRKKPAKKSATSK